jgi:hypothetical protein
MPLAIERRLRNELEHVEPVRHYEYRDLERFDRIAFAMHALRLLSPPKVTVAIYRAGLRLRAELAGLAEAPYVVDLLVNSSDRAI